MADAPDQFAGAPPLWGVRVLDLTLALAGPYCTLLLGDLGADVIKVEVPGRGDDSRHWGPPFLGPPDEREAAYFLSINRNKRSVALDLKSAAGLQAARDLAARCDVLVENFRPGTAARLGVGADDLCARDPRLIYCSLSGFGQDGPPKAGYDQIVQGMSGLMSLTGQPDGPPTKFGVPIGDMAAGMFAGHAILAALYERERSGRGRRIDVAMLDSMVALLSYQAGRYFATGDAPSRQGNLHPLIAPYGTFETADGYVNVCVGNDSQWGRCCAALGTDQLADDPRFATNADRMANRDELLAELGRPLEALSTAEVVARLDDAGVPVGPISTLDEVFADPAVRARGLQVDIEHPSLGTVSSTAPPWRLDGALSDVRLPPPTLGQHTSEVLAEVAGYSKDQIADLVRDDDVGVSGEQEETVKESAT